MNLTKTNWPLHWTPNADRDNGDPNGLLRADNLQQDDSGALVLVRNNAVLAPIGAVDSLWSTIANGIEYLFFSTLGGGTIYVAQGPNFNSPQALFGGSGRACFASALGQVLVCSGFAKNKVKVPSTVKSLGLDKPSPPTLSPASQTTISLGSSWAMITGHDDFFTDTDSLILVAHLGFAGDSTDGSSGAYDPMGDNFSIQIIPIDPSLFITVRVTVALDDLDNPTNYYYKDWVLSDSSVNYGTNVTSNLTAKRGEFIRAGGDTTLTWKTVVGIKVTVQGKTDAQMHFGDVKFVGGAKGVLNGYYQYATQSVDDTGGYDAKSPLSDPTSAILIQNGYVTVTPHLTGGANKAYIFRRSAIQTNNDPNNNLYQSNLDQWYQVAITGSSTEDTLSDLDAIQRDIVVNPYLKSVHTDLSESITGMIGQDNGRTVYMSSTAIYLSDVMNPDAFDTRFIFKVNGDPAETNLWIKQVSNQLRVLATTRDLYEISGTLVEQPDGTLDIQIRAIGEAFPPLSYDAQAVDGVIYYIARDGLRSTNGSNSINLTSPGISLLFSNQYRHDIPWVSINPGGAVAYGVAAGRDNIYCALPMADGTRRLLVYKISKNIWRLVFTDPLTLYLTGSGKLLGGYGESGLVEIETEAENDSNGVMIYMRTVSDSNGQPRNRKDTFTLKIVADTGGRNVSVGVAVDGAGDNKAIEGTYQGVGTISNDGIKTFYFPFHAYTLGFRYSFKLTASNLQTFRLQELTLEYQPRPEQLDYLFIQGDNLGVDDRKRWITYAFVIDTLGNNITFTPIIDGVSKATSTVNTNGKTTYIHYFLAETIGTDIGGILSGGVFEFYSVLPEKTISETLPAPAKFLVIPANDYGSPDRKRHTSYKFQINTRGANCTFTPIVDGTSYTPAVFNTSKKATVEYFFSINDGDVKGIDIGGTLSSGTPFEFYGVIVPQNIETLPPRLETYYTPTTDFGVPSFKRLRTLPIVIDTYGNDVTFTPIWDGVAGTTQVLNTVGKRTAFYYATTDIFCVDFSGIFQGSSPFEFYTFDQPLDVEVLPIPRLLDQAGPIKIDKVGKIFAIRLRLIATANIQLDIQDEDSQTFPTYGLPVYSTLITVNSGIDQVYEIDMPKNININVFRIKLSSSAIFFRFDVMIKAATSGMETDSQWLQI